MKYHSPAWWRRALIEQFKHIVRNVICRRVLRIEFGYTVADLLSLFILDRAQVIYDALIQKYPELKYLEKYVKTGKAYTSLEMNAAGLFLFHAKMEACAWAYDASINDIIWLLQEEIGGCVHVRLHDGTIHAVTVVGYDQESDEIVYHDPLGDPAFHHRIVWGFGIRAKSREFGEMCVGKPIRMLTWIPNERRQLLTELTERFRDRKLYTFTLWDYRVRHAFPNDIVVSIGVVDNNRLEMEFPDGSDGKIATSVTALHDPGEDVRPTYAQFSGVRLFSGYDSP